MPDPTKAFRFRHPVEVRFQDLDACGHAHHSRALIYFEEARWAYWEAVVQARPIEEVGYVVAEVKVRYRRRIRYPMTVDVGVRVSQLAGKHFVMDYETRSGEGELVISGSSVQVMYDYATETSTVIPASIHSAIEAWDGPFARAGASVRAEDRR